MNVTVDLNGCARCDADGHTELTFTPLTNPVAVDDTNPEHDLTHWAPCPTNGEPILLRIEFRPESEQPEQ